MLAGDFDSRGILREGLKSNRSHAPFARVHCPDLVVMKAPPKRTRRDLWHTSACSGPRRGALHRRPRGLRVDPLLRPERRAAIEAHAAHPSHQHSEPLISPFRALKKLSWHLASGTVPPTVGGTLPATTRTGGTSASSGCRSPRAPAPALFEDIASVVLLHQLCTSFTRT